MDRRLVVLAGLIGAVMLTLAGCAGNKPALSDELSQYTDEGDGCQQAVVAITYADGSLLSSGQETYQDFSDAVRSKIGSVAGTIELEVRDFPSEQALEQARRVAVMATDTSRAGVAHQQRIQSLREYRREAAALVVICGRYLDAERR